jgi:hypothetical protein
MTDFSTMEWWSLARQANWCDETQREALDDVLASRLVKISQTADLYATTLDGKFPKTIAKINEVILDHYKQSPQDCGLYGLSHLSSVLTDEVKDLITDLFVEGRFPLSWNVVSFIRPNNRHCLTLAHKFVERYKGSTYWHSCIGKVFVNMRAEDLDAGCALLVQGTPNIQALLLSRQDIKDEYIIVGLKALSKLKNPKNVAVKIKLDTLKRLAPKSRLEVVKHLIGFSNKYYYRHWYNSRPPVAFEVTPTKEELSELLFSCSLLFNDEVVKVVAHYDTYLARLKAATKEKV